MYTRDLKTNSNGDKGFTIIEMAIVVTLIGIFLAAAAQLYIQFEQRQRVQDTNMDLSSITEAISNYRSIYGRYPCPAPLTANRTDTATYGRQTDCADTSGPDFTADAGMTGAGVAVTTALDGATRVRTGMIPFRDLNLQEEQAYDGYRNRFTYSVTEPLAVSATFTANGGAISIINDQNATAIEPADSGHFIVFSGGENGAGAFNARGFQNPCDAVSNESENCDFTTDTVFKIAETGNIGAGNVAQFDDRVVFATQKEIPLWETTQTDELNISMKPGGNIGIGPTASNDPEEELQIDGILRAQDDPDTDDVVEGNVKTNNICDYSSDTNDCFAPKLIGGKIAEGGGMACPPGEFMVGIKNGAPDCEPDIQIRCRDDDDIVVGIRSDGTLDCDEPPERCETTQVEICGEMKTLFAAPDRSRQTVTGGWTREERYRCYGTTWRYTGGSGECTCNTWSYDETSSCGNSRNESYCGSQYTGNMSILYEHQCPSGDVVETVLSENCNCIETSDSETRSCPDGFNVGQRRYTSTNQCNNNVASCGPVIEENTCGCEPERETARWWCPNGLSGRYEVYRDFTCPNGPNERGRWGSWVIPQENIDANCSCEPSTTTSYRDCEDGLVGQIKVTTTRSCPDNEVEVTEDDSSCEPPPPVYCVWDQVSSSGGTSTSPSGTLAGTSCDCGSPQTSCKKFMSGNQYAVGQCQCK